MVTHSTFEVDRKGLAKLLSRKGVGFAVVELLQNAWDQNVTEVSIDLMPVSGRPFVLVVVKDNDPEGFSDLAHSYTLFAESKKKTNPEQRGRFNMGEKMVIALCEEATIATTTGTVKFGPEGRTHHKERTDEGSVFTGLIRMTRAELAECEALVMSLFPPVPTTFNGRLLEHREPVREFEAVLQTDVADGDGYLRRTSRKTVVRVYEPKDGEVPSLYEMGIPVVETRDRWHVSVEQKVPLNMDRDNVTPAYLRDVRTLVLNNASDLLTAEDGSAKWIDQALEDKDVSAEAVDRALTLRYGEKRVVYDPSDPEANALAMSSGYAVIPPRSLSKEAWSNVRTFGSALPAGRVTPSPKPYSDDGEPLNVISRAKWTEGQARMIEFAERLGERLVGRTVHVDLVNDFKWKYSATYGPGRLVVNAAFVKCKWDKGEWPTPDFLDLMVHEFGHEYESNHLSDRYYKALTRLAGKMAILALTEPEVFRG